MTAPPTFFSRLDEQLIEEKVRKFESLMIRTIVKGDSPSEAVRMVNIHEGVLEWTGEAGRFEAAVHTDEGPKTLAGVVARSSKSKDIQSGSLVRWQSELEGTDRAIRAAYDDLPPREALKTIGTIWAALDRTSELAAARSGILMGKIDKIELAESPAWFRRQKPELIEPAKGEIPANPYAVESTELLIRASVARMGGRSELEAEVDIGPLGRVIVDWHVPGSRLQWMVEAVDLPWPSIKLYQLSRCAEAKASTTPDTTVFHNAFDAVEALAEFVGCE